MCGLSGFIAISRTNYDASSVLEAMNRRLAHRGPDAEGYFSDANVHLGHRRLSVIDVASSQQPMSSSDGRYTLVYNGEIYNYQTLRDQLRQLGRQFRTNGDSEVLLQAIAEWGDEALQRVRGMFAFAFYDKQTRTLLIARDHLGVKPLYFAGNASIFAFASELKALLAHPHVERDLNLDALGLFLECQYIPAPLTIYCGIHKLGAGECLRIEAATGKFNKWKYWEPDYSKKMLLDEPQALEALEAQLRQSVESMLVADVPLGAFVSGGVDSSLIAAMMTDITRKPIETFNLGFLTDAGKPDRTQSEHDQALAVANHLGSRHHQLMVRPSDVTDAFAAWTDVFDEPFGDQAALPTMLLSKLTRQHVTVALTGEGADELFSGYNNYAKRVREEKITGPLGRVAPLVSLLKHLPAAAHKDRIIKAVLRPKAERYATIPNLFDRAIQPSFFSTRLLARQQTQIADYAARFFAQTNASSYLEQLMYIDMRLWLPDDLLTKVDRATMAYSLEARVPYLDHRFVEFAATLDPAFKQNGDTTKYLLKKLAGKYLPETIVHRNKQGFVMPLSDWLESGLKGHVDRALGTQGLARRGLFAEGALQKLRAEHTSGRSNHAGRIWALTVLEQWFSRYEPEFSL
jgi:asparagine synthase (glutamine-hydrolysing)